MAFWKFKAWFHDKTTGVLGLLIVAAILFGLWRCRGFFINILNMIGVEMPGK